MKLSLHPLAVLGKEGQPVDIPLDDALIHRLRRSMDQISARGDALAVNFYGKLFSSYPGLRPLFPADMAPQRAKLTKTLIWSIANLEKPQEIRKAAAELGERHVRYGAKPEHYPIVCELLVGSMAEVAGDTWTAELAADWRVALSLLSELMQH